MQKLILSLFLIFPIISWSQNGPAGIGNCVLWLKADAGTMNSGSYQTPFGSLTDWEDQSGVGNDASTFSGAPYKTSSNASPERRMNYNSAVFFDALNEEFIGVDLGMNESSSLTEFFVFQLAPGATTDYSAVFSLGGNSNGFHRLENAFYDNSFTIFDNNFTSNLAAASSSNTFENQTIKTGHQNASNFRGFHNGELISTRSEIPGVIADGAYRIGDIEGGNNNFSVGEIIIFNSSISNPERRRIETYLAIKYGISLAHQYRNVDHTSIYNNTTYGNDIIGIAREDISTLNQKQSHQLDDKDSTRIYLDVLKTLNVDNNGAFNSDKQYLVMGHDNGALNGNSNPTEYPAGQGIVNRIEREWKLTNTNFSGTSFSIDTKLENSPIDASQLRLLIDSDDDLSDGTILNPSMSFSNEVLTISNLDHSTFPINSTRYFTVVSINSSTPLPIQLLSFNASKTSLENVLIEWQTESEVNNDYFTIERSPNGIDWVELIRIEGAENSTDILTYSTIDISPYNGISYYRLKQTDFDKQSTYSQIRTINFNNLQNSELKIFPNPTNGQISINGNFLDLEQIKIYNVLGQDVTRNTKQLNREKSKLIIDLSGLKGGFYFIKTKTSSSKINKQ